MTEKATLNTRYHLQVMSTHTVDSSPSLLVQFNDNAYLFNSPEGISRIFLQSGKSMRRISKIFLGDLSDSSGLPGMILSTTEAGRNNLDVVGPVGTDHLIASYRTYTRRDRLRLHLHLVPPTPPTDALPPPIHKDRNLIVYAFPISLPVPEKPGTPEHSSSEDESSDEPPRKKRKKTYAAPFTEGYSEIVENSTVDHTAPGFAAHRLRGIEADIWRRTVIRDMFKGAGEPKAVSARPVDQAQQGSTQAPPTYWRGPPPLGKYGRLPPPRWDVKSRPSVCYLGVGPSLRGKFLPLEAEKRGVPQWKFAQLTQGERVWIPIIEDLPPEAGEEHDAVEKPKEGEYEKAKKGREAREKARGRRKVHEERRREKAKRQREMEVKDGDGPGYWVEAEDCMGKGQDGNTFLVVNIPSPAYLPSFLLLNLAQHFSPSSPSPALHSSHLRTVFYFLGPDVLHDERFTTFITSFPNLPQLSHRISSPDFSGSNGITFIPTAQLSHRLSFLDQRIFNIPKYDVPSALIDPLSLFPESITSIATPLKPYDTFPQGLYDPAPKDSTAIILGAHLKPIDYRIGTREAEEKVGDLSGARRSKERRERGIEAWKTYLPMARKVRQDFEEEESKRSEEGTQEWKEELRVTPLGTGSAVPSKYRNVSSTLLHLPRASSTEPRSYILLDAGEGTWGQICRRFGDDGEETTEDILRGLKAIFISHLHQDHHAGVATILKRRNEFYPSPVDHLLVAGPAGLRNYLRDQSDLFEMGLYNTFLGRPPPDFQYDDPAIKFVDNDMLESDLTGDDLRVGAARKWRDGLGLTEFKTVPVLHRCRAWGISIAHKSGWKVVFSGDTMPCEALVKAGAGATLLIHEATIADGLEETAREKGHSTFGQAIDIGRRMGASHILLTHFSARYPKLPPLADPTLTYSDSSESDSRLSNPDIFLAFDLVTLRLSDFKKMQAFKPSLDVLLGWDEDDKSSVADSAVEGKEATAKTAKEGKERKKTPRWEIKKQLDEMSREVLASALPVNGEKGVNEVEGGK